jgi:hypothetical protein
MGFFLVAKVYFLNQVLKPPGFLLATGLHPLVSKTAALLSECLRLRSTTNRMMSLLQELLLIWLINLAPLSLLIFLFKSSLRFLCGYFVLFAVKSCS